jgi:hypothetical protein
MTTAPGRPKLIVDNWLATGLRALTERRFAEAGELFGRVLRESTSEKTRTAAHCYLALATLAGAPPSRRMIGPVNGAVAHLRSAGGTALAAVLAAVIRDDFRAAGARLPEHVAPMADERAVHRLTRDELRLLAAALVPVAGPTWSGLAECAADLFAASGVAPEDDDPERRSAVPAYFRSRPELTVDNPGIRAPVLLGLAFAVAIVAVAVILLVGPWYEVAEAVLVAAACALPLTFFGLVGLHDVRAYRRAKSSYVRQLSEYTMRPTDRQMDEWLEADVQRLAAHGAERHRLNPDHLLVPPQAIVGVSNRLHQRIAYRQERVESSYAYRVVARPLFEPLARGRAGEDGRLRADHYHVVLVYLTRHRVCVFRGELEFRTGVLIGAATHTFPYNDVAAVSPRALATQMRYDDGSGHYRVTKLDGGFAVTLADGDTIAVNTGLTNHARTGGDRRVEVAWPNEPAHRTVEREMRAQLRRG